MQPVQLLGYGLFTPPRSTTPTQRLPVDQVKGQSIMMIAVQRPGGHVRATSWRGTPSTGRRRRMLGMCLVFGVIGVLFMLAAGRSKT